ncbi:hypothetical protein LshimejAT787_0100090 [Lyophyllum shimeji]|uniref:Uncharacterized protein n=1 Tax=Lyophyllum shimeji TaxID=47721 RepID=A0A9P3PCK8_LYOSH|nr:hypothetical protein LshimejAT787_0100090 [Lyophyllum shimeji]
MTTATVLPRASTRSASTIIEAGGPMVRSLSGPRRDAHPHHCKTTDTRAPGSPSHHEPLEVVKSRIAFLEAVAKEDPSSAGRPARFRPCQARSPRRLC